jgi:hypothetical protein
MPWIYAKSVALFLAGFVTLGIALWFGGWGFDAVMQQPQFGAKVFPDYRSMRSVVTRLKQENPELLERPVVGWFNNVPFSWLCYLQQDETNTARRLWWKGLPYTPTFKSRYEPQDIQTIEALKSQTVPFLLMTWERDKEHTPFLNAHWPKHLVRKTLHKSKKGVTLYLVTSSR